MGSKAKTKGSTFHTPKGRKSISKQMKARWANPVWAKKQGKLISKGLQKYHASV